MENLYIHTAWVNSPSQRLLTAQMRFLRSCIYFRYIPVFYTDNHLPEQRPKMDGLIRYAIANCKKQNTEWLIWINSDCEIVQDIKPALRKGMATGFHRTEIPSRQYCAGVDMFVIHESLWDGLTVDMPDMYVGATHIDWWLARYFQKIGKLMPAFDFIHHDIHEQSPAGNQDSGDPISQHNIDNFVAWAKRNGIDYESGWE